MKKKKFASVRFIVPRMEGAGVDTVATVTAMSTEREESKFLVKLDMALSDWFVTKSGREAWFTSCADFNVGDLSLCLDEPDLKACLLKRGIYDLNIRVDGVVYAGTWNFDRVLGEGEDLDA